MKFFCQAPEKSGEISSLSSFLSSLPSSQAHLSLSAPKLHYISHLRPTRAHHHCPFAPPSSLMSLPDDHNHDGLHPAAAVTVIVVIVQYWVPDAGRHADAAECAACSQPWRRSGGQIVGIHPIQLLCGHNILDFMMQP